MREVNTAEYQAQVAAGMTEEVLSLRVRRHLHALGLHGYHTHDSRRSEPGFPDWVIVGRRGILYRELKRQDGRVRPAQRDWLDVLTAAGANAGIWRPADLLDGTILRELQAIA